MIAFAELRANAWKFTSAALLVLAVAALMSALYFRGSAALSDASAKAAEQEADYQRSQVNALLNARKRDESSADLASKAEQQVATHTAVSNDRLTKIEVRYRDRPVEVPAVCPGPDPVLLQDLAEQTSRISAAADRLRGIPGAGQATAR